MAIDLEGGYTAEWRLMEVDTSTWGTGELVAGLDSVSITTSATDSVPMLQTGNITLTREVGLEFPPGWYRIQMLAIDNGGATQRIDAATLLFEKTSGTINFSIDKCKAKGFSVLKPVNEAKMKAGEWIPRGADGAEWAARIIAGHTPAPVVLEASFTLDQYYVWDGGTSYLKAVWQVLDAGNCVILIDGDGTIHVTNKPTEPAMEINAADSSLLVPGLDYDQDYSDIPNVYYAVDGTDAAVAVNDDPDSVVSTESRGWDKVEYDDDVMRVNGESLQGYADRKLEELSTVTKTFSYQREWFDLVRPFEIIRFHFPNVVHEDLRVLSQTYNCSHGILLDEELGQEVKLWQRS